MVTLEKLLKLRAVVKKTVCTYGGFLQLKTIEPRNLKELEELIMEDGAMPNLKALVIESSLKMKKLSPGLLERTNLQYLKLFHLSREFIDEVTQIKGED